MLDTVREKVSLNVNYSMSNMKCFSKQLTYRGGSPCLRWCLGHSKGEKQNNQQKTINANSKTKYAN